MFVDLSHFTFCFATLLGFLYPLHLVCLLQKERSVFSFWMNSIVSRLPAVSFFLISLSFFLLIVIFVLPDFSCLNAVEHSHSELPVYYRISAVWGNHEGSIFLWTWIMSLFHFFFTLFSSREDSYFLFQRSVLGVLLLFFLIFTEFSSNPFLKVSLPFENGAELNPILQDPVLAIHPPLIYGGYIGCMIPFSAALTHLMKFPTSFEMVRASRGWSLFTWSLLTLGILLGSWWAYYELGWGGWWFWDPVENASLLPWLLLSSLIHAFTLKEGGWKPLWIVFLSLSTFLSSVLGTFFVRSGLLESVHSFANDASRGLLILSFLGFLIVLLGFLIFVQRKKIVFFSGAEDQFSVSQLTLYQMVFFLFFFILILWGTLSPGIYKWVLGQSITIGSDFYHSFLAPSILPFFLLMALLTLFFLKGMKRLSQGVTSGEFVFVAGFLGSLFVSFGIAVLLSWQNVLVLPSFSLYFSLFETICLGTLVLTLCGLIFMRGRRRMILAHGGFLLFCLGAFFSSCGQEEISQILHLGDFLHFHGKDYVLQSVNQFDGPNYNSVYASLVHLKEDDSVISLYPEKRFYYIQGIYSTKPYILTNLGGDFYCLLGDGNAYDGWEVRMMYNPLMSWIWLGGLFCMVAGWLSVERRERG